MRWRIFRYHYFAKAIFPSRDKMFYRVRFGSLTGSGICNDNHGILRVCIIKSHNRQCMIGTMQTQDIQKTMERLTCYRLSPQFIRIKSHQNLFAFHHLGKQIINARPMIHLTRYAKGLQRLSHVHRLSSAFRVIPSLFSCKADNILF